GPGIGIGSDAEMERLQPSRPDSTRLAEAGLDFLKVTCRGQLGEGPAKMYAAPGMPKSERHFVGQAQRLACRCLYLLWAAQPDIDEGCPIAQDQTRRVRVIEFSGPA